MNGQQPMQGQQMQGQDDPMAMLQTNPALMQKIQTLPPEERQAFMQQLFQDYQGQEGVIDEQMAMAQELRGGASPQGQQTARGGYVAASPLSHAAKAVNTGLGIYQQKQALDAKKALSDARSGGVSRLAEMLARQNQERDMPSSPQRPDYTRGY